MNLQSLPLTGDHKAWSIPYEAHFYEALYEASPVSKLGWGKHTAHYGNQ